MNAYQKDTPEKVRIVMAHQKNLQEINGEIMTQLMHKSSEFR